MAHIKPFKAITYQQDAISRYEDVIVPPYDVISKEDKALFLGRSRFNFARIILGKSSDHYKSVGRTFKKWLKRGVLKEDEKSCYYVWEQSFLRNGKKVTRKSLVACVDLHDFSTGEILPHERTFKAPRKDRLKILRACKANLSPVFMMVSDPSRTFDRLLRSKKREELFSFKDAHIGESKIYRLSQDKEILSLTHFLKKKRLYIIDGHHRFATAYDYYSLYKRAPKTARFVLVVISNMKDPSVTIYPIFRLLSSGALLDEARYIQKLKKYFIIEKVSQWFFPRKGEWGFWPKRASYGYRIKLSASSRKFLEKEMEGKPSVKKLDVSLLEQKLIPHHIRSHLRFVRGMGARLQQAKADLKRGRYEALWTVSSPTIEELKRVSDDGQIMPQKSTFFYPKIMAGALIRRF